MNTLQMDTNLLYRLRDISQTGSFPAALRLQTLNNAQLALANILDVSYLTELGYLKTSVALSSGVVALTSANLTKDLLRGKEGILSIKNTTTGLYLNPMENAAEEDNLYTKGQNQCNKYDIRDNKLYVFPTSITSVDILFLQVPDDMTIDASVYPSINEAFHVLIIDLAEAECWSADGKFNQQRAAYLKAMDEINELNAPFKDKEWRKTKWRYLQPQYLPGFQPSAQE
ncbi:MAG: hypothetical protein ABII90_01775 [Bacteroidota bacterium]